MSVNTQSRNRRANKFVKKNYAKIEYHDNHFESDHFERHWVDPVWEVMQIERAINYHRQSLKMTKSDARKSQIQKQIENLEFDKCRIQKRNRRMRA